MQERPHLTRLLGVASLVAALALLFRIVAAITSMTAPDRPLPPRPDGPLPGRRLHADEERGRDSQHDSIPSRGMPAQGAGGDWNRWVEQLSPFRAELAEADPRGEAVRFAGGGELRSQVVPIEGRGDFALLESFTGVLSSIPVRSRIAGRIPQATSRGRRGSLAQEPGINVIFVPVPKMTEVYAEHFADYYPSDRVVAAAR